MKCPRIEIDAKKLKHNVKIIVDACRRQDIDVTAVTKVVCGIPDIASLLVDAGVKQLADSRIENIRKLKDFKVPKMLLRLPMLSQAEEVVENADISLNSEIITIERLSEAALRLGKIHNIILMVDLGDLREGVWKTDVMKTVEQILKLKGVNLHGLGTNLTCFGGVIPDEENLGELVKIAEEIEQNFGIEIQIISGGNSSSLHLVFDGNVPYRINNLRIGEAIFFGRETAYGNPIENTYQDVFTFVCEILELKEKPSVPIGTIGVNAFGEKPHFEDKGNRKRAIVSVGIQDVDKDNLRPVDPKLQILGGNSDYMIIDVTDSHKVYNIGDEIAFNVSYSSLLRLMTSEYIYKVITILSERNYSYK